MPLVTGSSLLVFLVCTGLTTLSQICPHQFTSPTHPLVHMGVVESLVLQACLCQGRIAMAKLHRAWEASPLSKKGPSCHPWDTGFAGEKGFNCAALRAAALYTVGGSVTVSPFRKPGGPSSRPGSVLLAIQLRGTQSRGTGARSGLGTGRGRCRKSPIEHWVGL